MQSAEEVRENLAESLSWRVASRDDRAVMRQVHQHRKIDALYSLSDGGLLDRFWYFLELSKVTQLLEGLLPEPRAKGKRQRFMIPFINWVRLYMAKVLYGIQSFRALPELLFSNVAAMVFCGFNAVQVREGICNRGDDRRQDKPKRGPVSAQALGQNIARLPVRLCEKVFNAAIKLLVAFGAISGELWGIIDPTDYETTEKYAGAGKVTRRKKIRGKQGKKEIKLSVFGWKVFVLYATGGWIPLAVKIEKINVDDRVHLRALIEQAITNLGRHAQLVGVVMDRGHIDGEELYWVKEKKGLHFVICAPKSLEVAQDARQLARQASQLRAGTLEGPEKLHVKEEVVSRSHGRGRSRWTEKVRTRLVGVESLTSYDQYGPPGHSKKKNKKSFEPTPINAVVAQVWDNHDYVAEGQDKEKVFLTDLPVTDPFVGFLHYDDRSLIENKLFREGKQKWTLLHPAEKSARGVKVHVYLTMLVIALATVFRRWEEEQEKAQHRAEKRGGPEVGIELYRRRLIAENYGKVIVFWEKLYAVCYYTELLLLLGVQIRQDIEPEVGGLEQTLERYGLLGHDTS